MDRAGFLIVGISHAGNWGNYPRSSMFLAPSAIGIMYMYEVHGLLIYGYFIFYTYY